MTQTQNIQKQNYVDMDLNEMTIRSARKDMDSSINDMAGSNIYSITTRQNVKNIISSLNPPTSQPKQGNQRMRPQTMQQVDRSMNESINLSPRKNKIDSV